MQLGEFWVILVVGIIALAVFIYSQCFSYKRSKDLITWAQSKDFTYSLDPHYDLGRRFPGFNCLNSGQDRYAKNLMEGFIRGRKFIAFDYHYSTGSEKYKTDHDFSALIMLSPFPLKSLLIRPENIADKLAAAVGFDDIDFESAEFSRKFFVKSPDNRWAYDVISQPMMEYLLSSGHCFLQLDIMHIIVWLPVLFSPADFESAANFLVGFLDLLPDYLVKQQSQLLKNN